MSVRSKLNYRRTISLVICRFSLFKLSKPDPYLRKISLPFLNSRIMRISSISVSHKRLSPLAISQVPRSRILKQETQTSVPWSITSYQPVPITYYERNNEKKNTKNLSHHLTFHHYHHHTVQISLHRLTPRAHCYSSSSPSHAKTKTFFLSFIIFNRFPTTSGCSSAAKQQQQSMERLG